MSGTDQYVAVAQRGRRIGLRLLSELTRAADGAGFWTLQTSVFPENAASVGLHRRCGFRVVGTRERVALHGDRWRDVVIMERRSRVVGR